MTDRNKLRARVFKSSADSQWYFEVIAGNGEIVADSEGHKNRGDAVDVAYSIIGDDGDVQILGGDVG